MLRGDLVDYQDIFYECRLHHVGMLVGYLPRLEWDAQGKVPEFSCNCYLKGQTEFVIPYDGRLLEAWGTSGDRLHQLAYEVGGLEYSMDLMRHQGFKFLLDKPVQGIGGMLCNFILPEGRGLLIELVELPVTNT
jgi:hypothetical protein